MLNRKHSSACWQCRVFAVIRSQIKVFYRFKMICWRCWMEFQRITKGPPVCHEGIMNIGAKCHDGLSNTSEDISLKTTNVNHPVALKKRVRGASRSAGHTVREPWVSGPNYLRWGDISLNERKLWPAGGAKEKSGCHQTHEELSSGDDEFLMSIHSGVL